MQLPANKFMSEEENENLSCKKIVLNSNDEIFAETRQVIFISVTMFVLTLVLQ